MRSLRRARSPRCRERTSRWTSSPRASIRSVATPTRPTRTRAWRRRTRPTPRPVRPMRSVQEEEEVLVQPISSAAIDLASGARYRATGKRKTAIARVTLRPGTGTYLVNGRVLEEHFPRITLQRNIRQPLETVGYQDRMDVVARLHGGGISAQAGALRHGVLTSAAGGRPEPARRAQAPRLFDARLARQGAQEGRPEEGAQAAAVLQAVADRPPT